MGNELHRAAWILAILLPLLPGCSGDDDGSSDASPSLDCSPGLIRCENGCVPADAANCGECGNVCPSGTCLAGVCVPPTGAGGSASATGGPSGNGSVSGGAAAGSLGVAPTGDSPTGGASLAGATTGGTLAGEGSNSGASSGGTSSGTSTGLSASGASSSTPTGGAATAGAPAGGAATGGAPASGAPTGSGSTDEPPDRGTLTGGSSTAGGSTGGDPVGGSPGAGAPGGGTTMADGGTGGAAGSSAGTTSIGGTPSGGASTGGASTGGASGELGTPIRPGYQWLTTDGTPINAQGGQILEEDGTYYWYGATFDPDHVGTDPDSDWFYPIFEYINCYSSTDLVSWTNHGAVFTYEDLRAALGPELDSSESVWVGRPGAWKNASGEYVISFGFMAYPNFVAGEGNARNTIASVSASSPTGQFQWQGSELVLGTHTFNDNAVFIDDDGSAYFIATPVRTMSDGDDSWQGTLITRLGPDGYFPTSQTASYPRLWSIEAPSIVRSGGTYYLYASDLDGWYNGNTSRYQSASSLTSFTDDMSAMASLSFSPATDWGYDSQIDFVIAVGSTMIYAGDRWSIWTGRGNGQNIWLPMNSPSSVEWHDEWYLDEGSGAYSVYNFVKNGTFEAMGDSGNPSACLAWTGSASLDGANEYEGSFAAAVGGASSEQTVSGLSSSTTYELTAMAKASGGTITVSVGSESQAVTSSSYTPVTLTVSGEASYVVSFEHSGTGTGYVDNVRLTAVD